MPKRGKLKPIPLTLHFDGPLDRAKFEIMLLSNRNDLVTNAYIGTGKLSPADIRENRRRHAELDRLRMAIIRKHGVEEHYSYPFGMYVAAIEQEIKTLRKGIAKLAKACKIQIKKV